MNIVKKLNFFSDSLTSVVLYSVYILFYTKILVEKFKLKKKYSCVFMFGIIEYKSLFPRKIYIQE